MIIENYLEQEYMTELVTQLTSSFMSKNSNRDKDTLDIVTHDYYQKHARKYKQIKKELNEDSNLNDKTKERKISIV